jgi:hypothetical protein
MHLDPSCFAGLINKFEEQMIADDMLRMLRASIN